MDDRLRIPQDSDYFQCIGLSVIAFARLEWSAAWCCERLATGYIRTIAQRRKTAGAIGRDLKMLFSRIEDRALRARIVCFAEEFCAVVERRNELVHAKPGTAPNGDQRLFRQGSEWSIEAVKAFSDRCARADGPLNALLYDEFKEPCTVALIQVVR